MTLPKLSDLDKAFLLFFGVMTLHIFYPQDWVRDMAIASFGVVVGGLQAHLKNDSPKD